MSDLRAYLRQKRQALLARRERIEREGAVPRLLSARATVEGRSGVRRVRIRDFQAIADSPPDFAGYDLGPSSPESQLGVLSSCLAHVFLIQAAEKEIPLDAVEIAVSAEMHPRAGSEGIPPYPQNITYTATVTSPASEAELADLYQSVEHACPILNLLLNPQQISGQLVHIGAAGALAATG